MRRIFSILVSTPIIILLYNDRVTYAETLCHGLVAAVVFYTAMPLFQASGAILSQMAPSGTTAAALNKCLRQVGFSVSTFSVHAMIICIMRISLSCIF